MNDLLHVCRFKVGDRVINTDDKSVGIGKVLAVRCLENMGWLMLIDWVNGPPLVIETASENIQHVMTEDRNWSNDWENGAV